MEGDPTFSASQDIPSFPNNRFAEMSGLKGIHVDNAARMGAAWGNGIVVGRAPCVRSEIKSEGPRFAASARKLKFMP